MSDETALVFTSVGIVLNFIGFVCSVKVLFNVQLRYGIAPMWPWLSKAIKKGRGTLRRLKFWGKREVTIRPESICTSEAFGDLQVFGRKKIDENQSKEERIKCLEEAVLSIYKEMDHKNDNLKNSLQALREKLNGVECQVNKESKRLEGFTKEAVSGDVRFQFMAILFIFFGTILVTVPTLWKILSKHM